MTRVERIAVLSYRVILQHVGYRPRADDYDVTMEPVSQVLHRRIKKVAKVRHYRGTTSYGVLSAVTVACADKVREEHLGRELAHLLRSPSQVQLDKVELAVLDKLIANRGVDAEQLRSGGCLSYLNRFLWLSASAPEVVGNVLPVYFNVNFQRTSGATHYVARHRCDVSLIGG